MGLVYEFRCKKCKHQYNILLGYGKLYSYSYKQTVENIKNGIYGDKWKNIFLSRDNLVVDIKQCLYTCQCGNWSLERALNLYSPKNSAKPAPPYVMEDDLKSDYYRIGHYKHICKKCSAEMHKTDNTSEIMLSCPECENINNPSILVYVDDYDLLNEKISRRIFL